MRPQDLLKFVVAAGVTFVLTVALFMPRAVDAVQGIRPVIAQPQFTSQGCVMEFRTDKPVYQADEMPALQIAARNPTRQSVETRVRIKVLASAPASPLARMLPSPQAIWSQEWAVRLEPGESKTAVLPTDAKLPAGQDIVITIGDKEDDILAASVRVSASLAELERGINTASGPGVQP